MASSVDGEKAGEGLPIPVARDNVTFAELQNQQLKELEKRLADELKKKRHEWEKQVERMREEFLHLYPSNKEWGSDELINDPLVLKRRGSTDVLDSKKMRTLLLEYPDGGRRYKIPFDVSSFDARSVRVASDGDRIIVRAAKKEEGTTREYNRKVELPKEVDATKLKCFLTSDGVLVAEASLPPQTLNLTRKLSRSPSRSSSHHSIAPSTQGSVSPATSLPGGQKLGLPQFHGEEGERFLSLFIDIGLAFKPKEVTVQILKDNVIQVKAKHEERTSERLCKHKFCREYELTERIETYSLRAGLTEEGRLIVGALGKGHIGFSKKTGGDHVANGIAEGADLCNVLDLATFPPSAQ
ncbi:hypothetical protein NP493_659g00017 [Ridgeia piscesae]|uniref:SHSP domain-containing protein n=1 Tax=Ridgeia piscesae TaxID=27915 RepID=A0AAD9KS47_RIDPI|nr:hypothetical protein NP493_659g00017 [Ridgeia piscesae]